MATIKVWARDGAILGEWKDGDPYLREGHMLIEITDSPRDTAPRGRPNVFEASIRKACETKCATCGAASIPFDVESMLQHGLYTQALRLTWSRAGEGTGHVASE